MKQCTYCNKMLSFSDFPRDSRTTSGYRPRCKACMNTINRNYRQSHKLAFANARKRHYRRNRESILAMKRDYYIRNREKKQAYDREYRKKNSAKRREQQRAWDMNTRRAPAHQIIRNTRRRIAHALIGNRKSVRTMELLGCTPEAFRDHLSAQFDSQMSWENYGDWHIDHIRPCYSFDLTKEDQLRECFHYTNCRPLWATENVKRKRPDYIGRPPNAKLQPMPA